MRMIFVNLPVADAKAATRFYEALGFTKNDQFSDDTTSCMVVSEQIYVMLLEHERFSGFINGEIADATRTKEVLNCLSAASRIEVETFKKNALAAGAGEWKPDIEVMTPGGPMFGVSIQDPDGHVWEMMYMDMSGAG